MSYLLWDMEYLICHLIITWQNNPESYMCLFIAQNDMCNDFNLPAGNSIVWRPPSSQLHLQEPDLICAQNPLRGNSRYDIRYTLTSLWPPIWYRCTLTILHKLSVVIMWASNTDLMVVMAHKSCTVTARFVCCSMSVVSKTSCRQAAQLSPDIDDHSYMLTNSSHFSGQGSY